MSELETTMPVVSQESAKEGHYSRLNIKKCQSEEPVRQATPQQTSNKENLNNNQSAEPLTKPVDAESELDLAADKVCQQALQNALEGVFEELQEPNHNQEEEKTSINNAENQES